MRNPAWHWDELVLACALVANNEWRELRESSLAVMDLSDLLQLLPLHPFDARGAQFRSPGSVSRKTTDVATAHPSYHGKPTRGGKLDAEVVTAFLERPAEMLAAAEALRVAAIGGLLPSAEANDGDGFGDAFMAPEGRLLALMHLRRERDPKLRRRKIETVRAVGAPLACTVCSFDFSFTYGSLGEGFIEVHHVVPLHISGETVTSLGDLALLCANCHRMCHRSTRTGEPWRTPAELRRVLRKPA